MIIALKLLVSVFPFAARVATPWRWKCHLVGESSVNVSRSSFDWMMVVPGHVQSSAKLKLANHWSFAGGEILATFARSGNQSGAWRLARFLFAPENALALARETKSVQPTAVGVAEDPYFDAHPEEKIFVEQLARSRATPNHPAWGEMESAIEGAVEEALYGRLTPEQAVAKAAREMERHLQAAKTAQR